MSATEQEDAALERLMALDLAWAERAHAKAMAAETSEDVERLGRTYQRAARSLRQTIALKADLRRKREAAMRPQAEPYVPDAESLQADDRIDELQDAVGRVIAAHHPDPRREREAWTRFDREADDWSVDDILRFEDLDEHVIAVCRDLGLPEALAARWRDLPRSTTFHDPEETGEHDPGDDPGGDDPGGDDGDGHETRASLTAAYRRILRGDSG